MIDRLILGKDGTERVLPLAAIAKFADGFGGNLIWAGDREYDQARQVWNGMVDKRPAVVAQCCRSSDALACIRFARQHELLVSVRGGGHNYAGNSVCNGGMVIDFSPMRTVAVDPDQRTARAEAGVRLGEFDQATQAYGLATTLGVNTDTGIAGLTLGGGYGWLAGRFGLACDNLIEAEVITPDARSMTVTETNNPDLLWGLRGAGANLVIVTNLVYRLHELGPVFGGMVIYDIEHGQAALRLFNEFSAEAPDEISTAGLLLHLPDGTPAVAIGLCYSGPLDKAAMATAPLLRSIPVLANHLEVQPYTKLQTLFDAAWPPRRLYYNKSAIARGLSEDAIECLIEHGRTMPTHLSAIAFQQLHGAAARLGVTEAAFPHRFNHFSTHVHPATDDPTEADMIVEWGRACWADLQRFMTRAVYVNSIENVAEESATRVQEAYGVNYGRVVALKQQYDPTNFLSANANVKPSG